MKRLSFLIFLIPHLTCFAESNIKSHPSWQLLNPEGCGMSNSDRIVGGAEAPIGLYPWLARIGYVPKNRLSSEPSFLCGGAVINKFYVITAAHCSADLPKGLVINRVRLGEHRTDTNPDCVNTFCNDLYKDYAVDEVIVHEEWEARRARNDIALLRVKNEIKFTDFVRPICVVKGKLLKKNFVDQIAEVAGWGVTDSHTGAMSKVLKTLKVPIRLTSVCRRNIQYRKFSVDSCQICAGGIKGQDSCSGDSGGPLMKVEVGVEPGSPRYFIIGLVSFGLKHCGLTDTPAVYTDLSKFMPWVLDHLRA